MPQVLVPDKIEELSIASTTSISFPSSIVTIGGQQYRNSSTLTCDLSTTGANGLDTGSLASDSTYFVYAVVSSGSMAIVASLNPDTTGPTGFSVWKLIGAFGTKPGAAEVDFIYSIYGQHGKPKNDIQGRAIYDDLASAPTVGTQNYIINGGFDFWQRGTDSGSVTSSGWQYQADRWRFYTSAGGGGTGSISRQTLTPGDISSNSQYYLRWDQTVAVTASSPALQIPIEDVRTLAGKTITLSFWAKQSGSEEFKVYTKQDFGSGGSSNVFSSIPTFTPSTSWQQFSFTWDIPDLSGKTIGTDSNFAITFGTDGLGTFTIDIADVMLNEGPIAAPFQRAGGTIGGELALCQRYYQRIEDNAIIGHCPRVNIRGASTSVVNVWYSSIVPFRSVPTYSQSATSSFAIYPTSGTTGVNVSGRPAANIELLSCGDVAWNYETLSGIVGGQAYSLFLSSAVMALDAEF